jgi:hypothetical protein
VAIYLDKVTARGLLGYNPKDDRILSVRLKGNYWSITIIQIYAPTTAAEDEEVENLYKYNTPQVPVHHEKLWSIMREMGFPAHMVQLINMLYVDQ